MASKASSVIVRFLGNTKGLDKSVKNAEKRLTGLQKFQRTANLAAAAGVAAAAGIMFQGAREFDAAQSIIQNATGKTGDELKGLTDQFQDVFSNVNKSSEEVATAIGALDTLVAGTDEQIGKLAFRLEGLSDVIGGDFASNSEKWGRIVNLWGINAEQASRSLDTLTFAGQQYGIQGDELMTRLQKHGETFKVLGLDVDEAALALGELYAKGADMRTLASGFEIMAGKAIEMGQDPAAAFKELTQRIRDAETSTAALAIATEEYAMGDKAAIAYVDVVRDGIDITRDYSATIDENRGRLEEQAEASKSVADKMEEMKNKIITAGMKLAEMLMPHFEKIIDWMSEDGNLNKALIGIGTLIGALYAAKVISGLAGLIAKIKAVGTTATAAAGAASVAGGVATGTGLALVLAKLGLIAAAVAVPFVVIMTVRWLNAKFPDISSPSSVYDPRTGEVTNITGRYDPSTVERLQAFGQLPEGPTGIPKLGDQPIPGTGYAYPQGGFPVEPEPAGRGPTDHPGGRTRTPTPRTGPLPTGADRTGGRRPGGGAAGGAMSDEELQALMEGRVSSPGGMLPWMAEGGIVREPTVVGVGEAGPEAIVPLDEGLGPQIVVNIYPSNVLGTKDDLLRDIQEGLNEAYRRNPAGNFRFAPGKRV